MGCPQTTVWGAQVLVLFVGGLLHAVIACVLAVSPTVFGRYLSAVELCLLWFVRRCLLGMPSVLQAASPPKAREPLEAAPRGRDLLKLAHCRTDSSPGTCEF